MITIGKIAKGISKITASKGKESLTKWLNETLPSRFKDRILGINFSTKRQGAGGRERGEMTPDSCLVCGAEHVLTSPTS
ncbi:MAG: hypothetical protein V7K86_08780, partial [Nostoc sp.]